MKRTGFKQKIRKPLKKSGFKKRTGVWNKKHATVKNELLGANYWHTRKANLRKRANRRIQAPVAKMQKACDALLTPIIKLIYPRSILSGQPTEVAHHHIKKSTSNSLRYYLPNLIPLTHEEHRILHANETYWNEYIENLKGADWKHNLDRKRQETVHTDLIWYTKQHSYLTAVYKSLLTKQHVV